MKVLGLITEYNPFHLGHKHHLEISNKELDTSHTVAIMSGSFVQRGQPSIVDKWTKARMAIDNGVDLVIELPFVYAVQSAELFALGAMKILDSMNIIDYISFGSEIGEIEALESIANILVKEPKVFKETLKNNLASGFSYSVSRSKAVEAVYSSYGKDNTNVSDTLKNSNNILGIEYIKAIKNLKSNITPYTISRLGHNYNDILINEKIASATGIRNKIYKDGIASIKSLIPHATYNQLLNFYEKHKDFNELNKYSRLIDYLLITKSVEELKNILDMEEGLENRFIKQNYESTNIDDLVQRVSTKRYPKTRIQRILIHLLAGLHEEDINKIFNEPSQYIRILASNKKGLEILRKVKDRSDIHIISKFADHKSMNNDNINLILNYEIKATDLFFFGINSKAYNMDYLISPYIK